MGQLMGSSCRGEPVEEKLLGRSCCGRGVGEKLLVRSGWGGAVGEQRAGRRCGVIDDDDDRRINQL